MDRVCVCAQCKRVRVYMSLRVCAWGGGPSRKGGRGRTTRPRADCAETEHREPTSGTWNESRGTESHPAIQTGEERQEAKGDGKKPRSTKARASTGPPSPVCPAETARAGPRGEGVRVPGCLCNGEAPCGEARHAASWGGSAPATPSPRGGTGAEPRREHCHCPGRPGARPRPGRPGPP